MVVAAAAVVLKIVGIVVVVSSAVGPGIRRGGSGSVVWVGGVGLGTDLARLVSQTDPNRTQFPVRSHSR